jgi:hypothetical protein
MRLGSLVVADMPLHRFVDLLTDMADVPVTLEPIELELAGVSLHQKVGIDAKDITVDKVLRDVFAKQRLELVETDGRVSIALAGGDKRRSVAYDVADLSGAEDATPIANLVQRFVAPDSWTSAGGGGTIAVEKSKLRLEHSQRVSHGVLIFCERLRLARGLSQRSRYPASLLATVPAYEAAAPALGKRSTFTFLPWTRLKDVLHHWQDASRFSILVDWNALAELELGPSSPVTCSAHNRSWEDVLDGLLEPIGLAWWAVNGETIQITSREALEQVHQIEFYEVPQQLRDQFATVDEMLESLHDELAELVEKSRMKPQPVVMELDEPSNRLIVLATPLSHRYLSQRLGGDAKQVALNAADQ